MSTDETPRWAWLLSMDETTQSPYRVGDWVVSTYSGSSVVARLDAQLGREQYGIVWLMDKCWPGKSDSSRGTAEAWMRPATPEEVAQAQLDRIGAEDAL